MSNSLAHLSFLMSACEGEVALPTERRRRVIRRPLSNQNATCNEVCVLAVYVVCHVLAHGLSLEAGPGIWPDFARTCLHRRAFVLNGDGHDMEHTTYVCPARTWSSAKWNLDPPMHPRVYPPSSRCFVSARRRLSVHVIVQVTVLVTAADSGFCSMCGVLRFVFPLAAFVARVSCCS